MSNSTAQSLRYLFDRPGQPIFRAKGTNGDVVFDVPVDYFTERYRPIANQVQTRFPAGGDGTMIPVKQFAPPNITIPMRIHKKANFSLFNDFHKECAGDLINTLMNITSVDELQSACVYAQQRLNPYLFVYAISVVMLHRPDTRDITFPAHVCSFPELYIQGTVISDVIATANVVQSGIRPIIEIPRDLSSTDNDVEHRLAYFREDIGLNMHHWHWHMVYPNVGPRSVVAKDRRGELFYYMHQQIMFRYNIERFCNDLPNVTPLDNLRVQIPEGYFPKLSSSIASRVWAGRQANAVITNVNREVDQMFINIQDMERWRDRIYEAIERGSVYRGSDLVPLTEADGIDVLGNIMESNTLSVNRSFYGNLHGAGHNILGHTHDPDNKFLETFSTIGDPSTSMRDPVFYRWHTWINDIFVAYKQTLPGYTLDQLSFSGISVTGLEVVTESSKGGTVSNVLQNHWEKDIIDLSRGVDFIPRGPIHVQFTHLQHDPFYYRITVDNAGAQRVGTVRIFIAPKLDVRGMTMRFREQRTFMIELDRFTTQLRPGRNEIQRRSIDSNLTVPFEVTFRNLDDIPLTSDDAAQNFVFCGCGWPDYMLLPKGTKNGLPCDLFVQITDYQQDKVDATSMESNNAGCDNAFIFCGIRNARYPDRRPMGYPFDRLPRDGVVTLPQFLTPNMRTQDVKIKFEEKEYLGVTMRKSNNANQGGVQQFASGGGRNAPVRWSK